MSEETKSTLANVDLSVTPEAKTSKKEKKKEKTEKDQSEGEKTDTGKDQPDAGKALFVFPGSPDKLKIEQWKQQYGEVLVSGFSETELFVFRPINRAEFVNLQAAISQAQDPISSLDVEGKICDTCVLWASPPAVEALERKAGSMTTLHEQIMQASNFVDPRFAASFVVKL